MKIRYFYLISFLLGIYKLPNCQQFTITEGDTLITISLEKKDSSIYYLYAKSYIQNKLVFSSKYKLPYHVWHIEICDLDNNNKKDIAIGVIKETYYDSVFRKRPFFFKLVEGRICPLWLGSSLSKPLEEFKIISTNNMNILQSIELEKNGTYLIAQYIWNGFGVRFLNYKVRNINKDEVYKIFKET